MDRMITERMHSAMQLLVPQPYEENTSRRGSATVISPTPVIHLPVLDDSKLEEIENLLIRNETDDALHTIISALYGKLLVVMGVAFPIIDALHPRTFTRFNGFYLSLNLGSIIFMAYIYALFLKDSARNRMGLGESHNNLHQRKLARYGSNYLRVGVAGFGIGSMIFSGIEFGRYFELNSAADCYSILIAVSPLARIVFVLMQMLYVFSNNKMQGLLIGEKPIHKSLVRFGLMHMIATNLCEWLYVLVEEAKQDIIRAQHIRNDRDAALLFGAENGTVPCWNTRLMQMLIQNSSPYLFPCTVEYSLLCTVILVVMWYNLVPSTRFVMQRDANVNAIKPGEDISSRRLVQMHNNRQSGVNIIYSNNVSRFSVDCANSHKGLFSGILILVLTIISLIMFFELAHVNLEVAVLQVNIWEATLFATAIGATLGCAIRLRKVGYRRHRRDLELEHVLLLVTQTGVFLYFLFQIFGGYHYFQNEENQEMGKLMRMITPIAAMIQSSCQTVLVLDAWRRQCRTPSQFRKKPGRELVTFILICNLALWIINRLLLSSYYVRQDNDKVKTIVVLIYMEFYGTWGWTVITHVTMPLVVCYRFQSTVCLYEIWKHVYKNSCQQAQIYHGH